MDWSTLIRGERPAQEANPSQHSGFRTQYPTLFAPLQTEAYHRVREGRSCALVAPTSSGKTLAVAAPLFESHRPAVFVLPFRSLILDQSQELVRIARIFGLSETSFGRVWGGTTYAVIDEAIRHDYLFITPDKLISLFIAGRNGNSAALSILSKYDFVFDEIHVYNPMMLTSLLYFLRSVRYWQMYNRRKSGFYFLSATFPSQAWEMLQQELGMTDDDRIEGISCTGDVRLLVKPTKTVTKNTNGQVPIVQDMEALGITRNVVGIFNSAYRAWRVCEGLGGLLFIGQDKLREAERRRNFDLFSDYPDEYALIGSPAIEAGVDFVAKNLVIEESYQDSTVQRFGRAARGGSDAFVLAYSDGLYALNRRRLLAAEYTRAAFLEELRKVTQIRHPRRLFAGLGAYPYYCFWKDAEFPMEDDHRKLCERLSSKAVSELLAFRGLTPYTHYDSGESISFKALFRKALPINESTGKVRGSPHPTYYFTRPRRDPVFCKVCDIAEQDELENGNTVVLAEVRFSLGLGTHWVLLEVASAKSIDDEDDNIRLRTGPDVEYGRRADGSIGDLLIRFYDQDV